MKRQAVVTAMLLVLGACGSEGPLELPNGSLSIRSAERWSAYDDPGSLKLPLEHNLTRLPVQGAAATTPWVGSYWPIYLDNINYRWAGPYSESAAAKYGRAFGITNMEDLVSHAHGLQRVSGSMCYSQSQCRYGEMCGRRSNWSWGICVPLWWGICHAWASAAILHPEPRHAVVYNGVEFRVSDLKALLSLMYSDGKFTQVSLRCELPEGAIPYDAAGRPIDSSCRDSNPGTYHLLLTNLLGLRQQSFIEDRTLSQDVWNQPIRAFRVEQMQEISSLEANGVLGIGNRSYPYNPAAERFMYVAMRVYFIREAAAEMDGYLGDAVDQFTFVDRYEYVLELDRYGDIIGGEWAQNSKHNHPDFLWLPTGPGSEGAANGAISYENVMKLVEMSYE